MFPYKHIIWDWNGTLLDDSWLSVHVINKLLAKRQMPTIDHDHYTSIFGFPVIDYYKRLGFDFEAESFEVIGTEFIDGYEAQKFELELYKDTRQVLSTLANQGVTHSILSAYKQSLFWELIDHFELKDMFINILGLDDHYAHSKVEVMISRPSTHEINKTFNTLRKSKRNSYTLAMKYVWIT